PASGLHPAAMTPADPRSLGLRVPNHALALEILAATGPLATTSANRSGQPALVRLEDIAQQFPQVQVLSPSASGVEPHGQPSPAETQPQTPQPQTPQPSTIVAWQRQGWQVLRQGAIALSL
ncbi:MAG: Sua5/YciO/YrdC/YwlC family protein, partial [Synechococcales cyanobacterium RM1_1_8]|nr:Sua5/YciO/YrdC/YwlC family protein [Synechococcales cyanobacterium RM1_1_8]